METEHYKVIRDPKRGIRGFPWHILSKLTGKTIVQVPTQDQAEDRAKDLERTYKILSKRGGRVA